MHRLWRSLPQDARRRWLIQASAWLAPRPDQPAPPARAGLAVAGELDRASGLGQGARLMLHGLETLGVPVELGPVDTFGAAGAGVSVYFRDPDGSLLELITYPAP